MKKMLRRIIALVAVITLVSAPTQALAKDPDYVYEDPSLRFKCFYYESDPIVIYPGYSDLLRNNDYEGYYYLEEGENFLFFLNLKSISYFRIIIYNLTNNSEILEDMVVQSNQFSLSRRVYKTGLYGVIVMPASHDTPVVIWQYGCKIS